MNLQPKFFDYIKNGTKKIELRLYDKKRQQVQIGDKIKFTTAEGDSFETEVIGLLRYRTFRDLFEDFEIAELADDSMTKEELLEALGEFYPAEKQEQFGVVGIRIRK